MKKKQNLFLRFQWAFHLPVILCFLPKLYWGGSSLAAQGR